MEDYKEIFKEIEKLDVQFNEIVSDDCCDREAKSLIKDYKKVIKELQEEKQSIIECSTWDDMRMDERDEIDWKIERIEYDIKLLEEYLKKESIDVLGYYIYANQYMSGPDEFETFDEVKWKFEEYVKMCKNGRVSLAIEYEKWRGEYGLTELIVREPGEKEFKKSKNIDRLQIVLSKEMNDRVDDMLEKVNKIIAM